VLCARALSFRQKKLSFRQMLRVSKPSQGVRARVRACGGAMPLKILR
jgi:hypothetical protein